MFRMLRFSCANGNRRAIVSMGTALVATSAVFSVFGCSGSGTITTAPVTEFGPARSLGNGTARAFITRYADVPQKVGVEFTENARVNLPKFQQTPSGDAFETLLPLPAGTNKSTAFEGLSLFWSPGHPPAGNQSVSHWHLDAYLINQSERMALSPGLQFDPTVSDENLVPGHIDVFVFVPQQGYIYIDPTIEMWYGRPFSTTGYAFYYAKGAMTTMEISAADTFLASKNSNDFAIPQPQKYPKPGYYPTHGSVTYDATKKVYTFTMDKFVKR